VESDYRTQCICRVAGSCVYVNDVSSSRKSGLLLFRRLFAAKGQRCRANEHCSSGHSARLKVQHVYFLIVRQSGGMN
jgi:hypothetical protein